MVHTEVEPGLNGIQRGINWKFNLRDLFSSFAFFVFARIFLTVFTIRAPKSEIEIPPKSILTYQ